MKIEREEKVQGNWVKDSNKSERCVVCWRRKS